MFESSKENYKLIFYEVIDMSISSLQEKSYIELSEHLENIEAFATEKMLSANRMVQYYRSDFDSSPLIFHRDMFLDMSA